MKKRFGDLTVEEQLQVFYKNWERHAPARLRDEGYELRLPGMFAAWLGKQSPDMMVDIDD